MDAGSCSGPYQVSSHILLLLMECSEFVAVVVLQCISHGIDTVLQRPHPFEVSSMDRFHPQSPDIRHDAWVVNAQEPLFIVPIQKVNIREWS